jgi:hypothetical protein
MTSPSRTAVPNMSDVKLRSRPNYKSFTKRTEKERKNADVNKTIANGR